MVRFRKEDKVRIRLDTSSPFRGRTGIVEREPNELANIIGYIVKLESGGNITSCLFDEALLEAVTGE